jgi:ATP-dependent Clp protease adaptor protein ClpS
MIKVLVVNDQVTPMAFVVSVLQETFGQSKEEAERTALLAHLDGDAVCGIYHEHLEAQNLMTRAMELSRRHGYPLSFSAVPIFLRERVGACVFRMIMKVAPTIASAH